MSWKSTWLVVGIFLLVISIPNIVQAQKQQPQTEERLKIYNDTKDNYYFKTSSGDKVEMLNEKGIPKFVLWRWNQEDSLNGTVMPFKGEVEFEFEAETNKLKWKGKWKGVTESEVEIEMEPLNQSEEGAFELWIRLLDNKTNTFSFPISDSGLEFYYQPPLNEEVNCSVDGCVDCNQTHCWDENNTITTHRPIDVIGSYAVYHSTKAWNQYKAGKLFHIYRPEVCDFKNNCIWAELNISDSTLTVKINQTWLNSANYPVIIDPGFGYDSAGGSNTETEDVIVGSNFTISEDGTAHNMTVYISWNSVTPANFKTAIYKDSDSSLVENTTEISYPVDWRTFDFVTEPSLTSGTSYVLVAWSGSNPMGMSAIAYDTNGYTDRGHTDSQTYGDWVDPASFTHNNNIYSIYCNYTIAGDTTSPTYTNFGDNSSSPSTGDEVKHYVKWSDETGLSGWIFGWNDSGSWSNTTWNSTFDNGWANLTKSITASSGIVGYRYYANDTSNNWNLTTIGSYSITAANNYLENISETITMTDLKTTKDDAESTSSQTLSFTDLLTSKAEELIEALDTFSLTDLGIYSKGIVKTFSEDLTLTDYYQSIVDSLSISLESISITDSLDALKGITFTTLRPITLTDLIDTKADTEQITLQTFTPTDLYISTVGWLDKETLIQTFTLTDLHSEIGDTLTELTQTFSLTDLKVIKGELTEIKLDTITFSDLKQIQVKAQETVSESITISPIYTSIVDAIISFIESIVMAILSPVSATYAIPYQNLTVYPNNNTEYTGRCSFNVTWNTSYIDMSFLEINDSTTGALTNYTMSNESYTFYRNLNEHCWVTTWHWKIWGNETREGRWNSTDRQLYTVAPVTGFTGSHGTGPTITTTTTTSTTTTTLPEEEPLPLPIHERLLNGIIYMGETLTPNRPILGVTVILTIMSLSIYSVIVDNKKKIKFAIKTSKKRIKNLEKKYKEFETNEERKGGY